jgi:hypothetical protein
MHIGRGLQIHVRTLLSSNHQFSYKSVMAIQIGEDILEVAGHVGLFWVNIRYVRFTVWITDYFDWPSGTKRMETTGTHMLRFSVSVGSHILEPEGNNEA